MATLVTTNTDGRVTRTDKTNDAAAKAAAEYHAAELGWNWVSDDGTVLVLQNGGETLTVTLSRDYTTWAGPRGSQVGVVESGSRSLGRDHITVDWADQPVRFYRTSDPTIFAGFQSMWLTGSGDGVTAELGAGAGMGSVYMTLTVTLPDGSTVYEYVDAREFLQARLDAIQAEHGIQPAAADA